METGAWWATVYMRLQDLATKSPPPTTPNSVKSNV